MNVPLRVAAFWLAYAALFLGLGLVLGLVPPAGRMLVSGVLITTATMALTGRTSLAAIDRSVLWN